MFKEIERKLKKHSQIGLAVDSFDLFILLESVLLKNGFHWNGRSKNTTLSDDIYNGLKSYDKHCIHINFGNYYGADTITHSTNRSHIITCDVFLNKDNFDYFINSVFTNGPSYKPKKKIIRQL